MRQFKGIEWILAVLLFLSFHTSVLGQQAPFNPAAANYLWPITISHHLTSTFAETRSNHFHAALDLKTWGRIGYPVYATRSGTLHRIAIGPRGYGKVLYLKHDDGSYSLYAHLMRFSEEIQQLADSIRFDNNYSASIDVVVDSLHINIEQGQQIAFSGATGIGPPHLHFELRTPENNPFNPLLTNLHVKDTIAPVFVSLAVEPLSIQSRIEGKNHMYTRNAQSRGATGLGVINVAGPVGLAVNVYDQSNGVHNVYAPYRLALWVDGKQVFSSTANQFSYAKTSQMFIDRIYKLLQKTGDGYQRLYVADGNTLSFYESKGNGGRLKLSPGKHHIEIEAADYYGNTTRIQLTLNVKKSVSQPLIFEQTSVQTLQPVDATQWNWFNDWVNIPRGTFKNLTLTPLLKNSLEQVFYYRDEVVSVNLTEAPRFYFSMPDGDYFIAHRAYPNRPTFIATPDKQAYASFPEGTFFDTTSIAITKQAFAPDSIKITLLPYQQPIGKDFKLTLQLDSSQAADSLAFYIFNPKYGSVWMLPTQRDGNVLQTSAFSLGTFMVLDDSVPPTIGRPRIKQRTDGQWLIYIPVEDNRSGIAYKKSKVYVNSVRGLAEYQAEDGRLVYYHPDFIPQNENTLRIHLADKMGNTVKKTIHL